MEEQYERLAARISTAAVSKQPGRLLVGIAGPPGSGKTTVAIHLVDLINKSTDATTPSSCRAQAVSLDGFHYPRSYLDTMPNREEAYIRRGAPWTFDVDAITKFVKTLFASAKLPAVSRPQILAPSFDHALKDPKVNDVTINPETSVVVLDGNYILLDEPKWREISLCLDLRVFVNVDTDVARDRVARRHVMAGIEPDLARGLERFDTNDLLNGQLIREKMTPYDVTVESISTI